MAYGDDMRGSYRCTEGTAAGRRQGVLENAA